MVNWNRLSSVSAATLVPGNDKEKAAAADREKEKSEMLRAQEAISQRMIQLLEAENAKGEASSGSDNNAADGNSSTILTPTVPNGLL